MSLSVCIKKKLKGFTLDVNFENNNDSLGILGHSGSGKSMTLKCIAGLERPDEGRIVFNGRILYDSDKNINIKPQDRNVGYLFQNYALFPNMNVEQNISSGLRTSREQKNSKTKEMLELFHLEGMGKKYPSQLSGGQQQRVALARIFAYCPDVLLLDEPFSALDSHLKEELQTEVLDFLKLYKGDVIMVTHQREEVYKFCKKISILNEGKSIIYGDMKEIFNKPQLVEAAKITGCKNISPCDIVDDHTIYMREWDISLQTKKEIPENITHAGMRAHNFTIVENNKGINVIDCDIISVSDELFEYSVVFKRKNSQNIKTLLFKIAKSEWNNRINKNELFLHIHEDSILFLSSAE